jgi:hypothetical protein
VIRSANNREDKPSACGNSRAIRCGNTNPSPSSTAALKPKPTAAGSTIVSSSRSPRRWDPPWEAVLD